MSTTTDDPKRGKRYTPAFRGYRALEMDAAIEEALTLLNEISSAKAPTPFVMEQIARVERVLRGVPGHAKEVSQ